jgi:hypothetical protein
MVIKGEEKKKVRKSIWLKEVRKRFEFLHEITVCESNPARYPLGPDC